MLKKALAGILTALLCTGCFFGTAVAATEVFRENAFTKCAENSLYELYVIGAGERSGEFYVKSKSGGEAFYSNPQNRDFSPDGLRETEKESSQLLIQLYSEKSGALRTLNSFTGAGEGKYVTVALSGNGFDTAYRINGAVKLKLKIRLTEKGFTAETDVSKINNIKKQCDYKYSAFAVFFSRALRRAGLVACA